MKKTLLSFLAASLFGVFGKASAQSCNIGDIAIQNVNVVDANDNDGKCYATFDASFTISNNPNSKYIFIQTYIASATRNGQPIPEANPNPFPDYFGCNGTPKTLPPNGSQIGSPLLNIVIDNSGATPTLANDYILDPNNANVVGVITGTQGTQVEKKILSDGTQLFSLTGIQIEQPFECSSGTEYVFISTMFTTASTNLTDNVTCLKCSFTTPTPSLSLYGTTNCSIVEANFENFSSQNFQGTYTLYSDTDNDGLLLATADGGQDVAITSGSLNIAAESVQKVTYTLSNTFIGKDVFVAVDLGGGMLVQLLPTIECVAPLPVTLKSFNAKRVNTTAVLNWETVTETNNRGYYVQRNSGGGWKDVSFVASKASSGNSSSLLTYEYNEANTEKAVTQYRLKQVDIDGKFKISEIRSIKGASQSGKTMVYPNPSTDGSVNILFNDERGNRDVFISDMGGRVIKQYRNVSASTMRVDQLNPGIYTLRITNQATGSQQNEKLVINK